MRASDESGRLGDRERRGESRAAERYAAWNPPWCAIWSRRSGPSRNTGFSDGALASSRTTSSSRRERVERDAVHLRQGPQPERVLDPGRRSRPVGQCPHPPAHLARAGERRDPFDELGERLAVAVDGGEGQRGDHDARARASSIRSAPASAASPMVAALLLISGRASDAPSSTRVGSGNVVGASPISASAVVASAGRSRRADAAVLAHVGQRVGGEHGGQPVEDGRRGAAAAGRELVEPYDEHRAHPYRRAERPGGRGVAAQQRPGVTGRVVDRHVAVGPDARGPAVERALGRDPLGERGRAPRRGVRASSVSSTASSRRAAATISAVVRAVPSMRITDLLAFYFVSRDILWNACSRPGPRDRHREYHEPVATSCSVPPTVQLSR